MKHFKISKTARFNPARHQYAGHRRIDPLSENSGAYYLPHSFLTARVESADKIIGFQAGADDYIIKPFDLDELGARVAAHLRREQRHRNKATIRFFGELTIDYSARTVTVAGEPVALSKGNLILWSCFR